MFLEEKPPEAPSRLEAPPRRRPFSLALGVERLGLLPLRYRWPAAIFALLLCVAAAFGALRLRVDDSLSQLFRADTEEFRRFEQVSKRFPSSEYDVLIVIEGKRLLERDSLDKIRDLVTEVQLVDGVRGVVSLFSARQPPEGGRLPAPLFPDPLPEGDDYRALVERVMGNEILRGKLLSEDGQLTLAVLALEPGLAENGGMRATISEIRETLARTLEGAGLTAQLSGVPVMQLEIRTAVERDRLIYNTLGFVAGCLIAILFFRHFSFMIMAAGPPLVAILLALGALGWFGFRLNMFLNVMTPLIMVIGFSDSMQLTFAARDRLLAGQSKQQALREALLVVGPACALTHATAALSFVALQFASSDLIRTFGLAGLISTLIALLAILLLTPLLGVLFLRDDPAFVAKIHKSDLGVSSLRGFCAFVAARMVRRPGLYSLLALAVVALLGVNYASLEPRYRLADQVPDKRQAVAASGRLDAKLTGANPIDVLIEFPGGARLYDAEALEVIAAVHSTLSTTPGVGNVWSLETLRRWLAEKAHRSEVSVLQGYVDILPDHLKRRFIAKEETAVVVSGRIPDLDASELLPVIDKVDAALDAVRRAHPAYSISVTGLAAIAARNSAEMIGKLNRGLTLEFAAVAIFIGLAFRSVTVMLSAFLPGIFPILAAGALLGAQGLGLQFASVIALTVSFGLGLSATIHFLNRQRLEDEACDDPALAIQRATVLVGPALILTSAVLACGLASTTLSDLPSLRLFGWLSAFAIVAALFADLFILRPTAMELQRLARRFAGGGRRG